VSTQDACFDDSFRESAGQGATFDMAHLRYASSNTPCPRQALTRQHDLPACIFVHHPTGQEVTSVEARLVGVDTLECSLPDLQALQQGLSTDLLLELQVTLDGGQHRSRGERSVGVAWAVPFVAYVPPRISHVSPDTGPLTETTGFLHIVFSHCVLHT